MPHASAIGFVPAAPLLVPQVAGGSAHLDADLREACREVARRITAAAPDVVTIVAPLPTAATWPADGATWGFEGFGVPRDPADPRSRLPWPLGIGDWLLDDIEWSGERRHIGVLPDGSTTGAKSASGVVLALGDGTARRTEKAPGHLDARAEAFDAEIAAAIRAGDAEALAGIDPALAADLLCAGAPVWRWIAAALEAAPVTAAELWFEAAPYGVAYFAGFWRL